MIDRFEYNTAGLDAPAGHGFAIVPHDTDELSEVTRALYVGSAGTLAVVLASGAAVTLANIAGGSILPLRVRQVKATNTTAAAIVGLV